MSCNHPLKAWPVGITAAGKTQYKVTSFSVNHLERRNGVWYPVNGDFVSPYNDGIRTEFVQIPCGKCIGCRLDYSKQWANRLMLEAQYHDEAYFVTLTYDDDHVPITYYDDPSTGEALQAMTLRKRDLQLFMKRLRKWQDEKFGISGENGIRFFASGEYGSRSFRPHYHAIIFGLHLDDLVFYKYNDLNQPYYISESLESIWSIRNPDKSRIGIVVVAKVTYETCAYTARYTAKKNNTESDDFFERFNMEKPFTLMSRRPGIGRQYYDDHPDMFDYSTLNIPTSDGGKKVAIPKYFQNFYDVDYPEESQKLKDIRKRMAIMKNQLILDNTDLDYESYLQVVENGLINRTKILERSAI